MTAIPLTTTDLATPTELELRPRARWRYVGAAVLMAAAAGVSTRGGVFEVAFPLAALMVGLVSYRLGPRSYLTFAWWLWLLTPGIRRFVDGHAGWNQQNPVLLAPLVVSLIAVGTLMRRFTSWRRRSVFPFALLLGGVTYGYAIGMGRSGIAAATYAAASWLAPLFLGLYVTLRWERYPEMRDAIQRVFLWGTLVLGLYGIAQFVNPADWDRQWMTQSDMHSIGQPAPFQVRVFSLVNSPAPLACVLTAGLVLLFATRTRWRLPVAAVGYVALMLTLVRASWLAWAVAVLLYGAYLGLRAARRFLFVVALLAVAVVPLATIPQVAEVVLPRVLTLSHVKGDVSYGERLSFLRRTIAAVVDNPVGEGLGATGSSVALRDEGGGERDFDNGMLDLFYSLGWPGGTLFVTGLATLCLRAMRRGEPKGDLFAKGARAIALSTAMLAVSFNVFSGVAGVVLWTFLGALGAAKDWRQASDEQQQWEQPEPPAAASQPWGRDVALPAA
ncbi:MAG TPA: O-antigen ligase family protein [Gemmatimonadaceae bacterium]|nr:O-antigen ligase family protein [Gemmatimonadaceae bacterium]